MGLLGCGERASGPQEPSREKVVFAMNAAYPPLEFVDPATGRVDGFSVELARAIGEKAGVDVSFLNIDWKAIFGTLETGDADALLSSVTITEERRKKYDFSSPYLTISQKLVVRRGEEALYDSPEELSGKPVGAELGTTGALVLQEKFPMAVMKTYDSAPLGFADLKAGTIVGLMMDEPVAYEYAKHRPETKDTFTVLPNRFSEESYGIVVKKGDAALLGRIDGALAALTADGTLQRLRDKWLK